MSDLKPITALGADAPRRAAFGSLTLSENTGLALASLALRRDAETPRPMGVELPGPGRWSAGAVSALWTGPGQWMIEAQGRAVSDFARDLVRAAPGCSVTEQTDGWAAFEIASSAGPAPLLRLGEKLANIDFAAFGPGSATRTLVEHLSVFLIRRDADHLAVLGMRSAAGSLWHALTEAAQRLAPAKQKESAK